MKIKYLGHSSFRISGDSQFGETVNLVIDPFSKDSVGINYPKQEADVVTLSHLHDDHNAIANVNGTNSNEFILIDTPGEYEIKGLRILGIKSYHDDKSGKERGSNTIFVFDFEEARVAHLGDLGHTLESEQLEALENIDILMLPVGGKYTINPEIANHVIESIQPSISIPMHYKTPDHNDSFNEMYTLSDFLKETGIDIEPIKELTLKSHNDLIQYKNIVTLDY